MQCYVTPASSYFSMLSIFLQFALKNNTVKALKHMQVEQQLISPIFLLLLPISF